MLCLNFLYNISEILLSTADKNVVISHQMPIELSHFYSKDPKHVYCLKRTLRKGCLNKKKYLLKHLIERAIEVYNSQYIYI